MKHTCVLFGLRLLCVHAIYYLTFHDTATLSTLENVSLLKFLSHLFHKINGKKTAGSFVFGFAKRSPFSLRISWSEQLPQVIPTWFPRWRSVPFYGMWPPSIQSWTLMKPSLFVGSPDIVPKWHSLGKNGEIQKYGKHPSIIAGNVAPSNVCCCNVHPREQNHLLGRSHHSQQHREELVLYGGHVNQYMGAKNV